METPVFIIHGFLESGKTTFINDTIRDPQFATAGKLLIIQCEEGEEEFDEPALAKRGVSVITVESEDKLTDEFLASLEIFYKPNMVMVEMNGMWKLTTFLELNMPGDWVPAQIITMIDATTIDSYLANMRSIMLEQVKYSDIAIVNRCTDQTDKTAIRRALKPVNRRLQLIYEREDGKDAGPDEPDELPYDISQPELEITDDDYGLWYMDAMDRPDQYVGKTVHFLAMAYTSKKLPKGYFVPGRMAMTCCADDVAFIGFLSKPPVTVPMDGIRTRGWYRVTAVIEKEYQKEYQGEGPVLRCTKLETAEEPADKLVYFN